MCLIGGGQPPSQEEQLQITSGWKVFLHNEGKLLSPYRHYIFSRRGWNEADMYDSDSGFHVFRNLADARKLQEYLQGRESTKQFVVKKVQVKDILGVGLSDGMGGQCNGHPAFTCKLVMIGSGKN